MTISTQHSNAQQAAYDIREALITQGWQSNRLSARPWNMYDPDNTLWWLIPSTEWPAYKHGKLFFSSERAPEGHLFYGLHVEKGLNSSIATALSARGKRLIMKKDDDWIWFDFMDDLRSGKICSAIAHASESILVPIEIRLEAEIIQDPESYESRTSTPKRDIVIFESSDSVVKIKKQETPSKILINVARSQTLGELAISISAIPNVHWTWLDIFIGSVFAQDVNSPDAWNGFKLWTKALSIWEPWFK